MTTYIIYSSEEEGCWNNEFGWVENPKEATFFTKEEKEKFDLPLMGQNDARWIEYESQELLRQENEALMEIIERKEKEIALLTIKLTSLTESFNIAEERLKRVETLNDILSRDDNEKQIRIESLNKYIADLEEQLRYYRPK